MVRVTKESVLLKEGKKVETDLRQTHRQVREVGIRHLEHENGRIRALVRLGQSVKGRVRRWGVVMGGWRR